MKNVPKSQQGFYEKAKQGSKANAIKAKCLDCSANQREEVTKCPVKTCPLWYVRPYQKPRD